MELTINSGTASEGDRAGAAKVTAEWLEAGGAGRWNSRQLRETIDALGASLDISVTRDALRLGMAVTSDRPNWSSAELMMPPLESIVVARARG